MAELGWDLNSLGTLPPFEAIASEQSRIAASPNVRAVGEGEKQWFGWLRRVGMAIISRQIACRLDSIGQTFREYRNAQMGMRGNGKAGSD